MRFERVIVTGSLILAAVSIFWGSAAAGERRAVSAPVANVRSGPGSEYPVVFQSQKYYPVEIVKIEGDWILIQDFEKDKGWLHRTLLDETPTVIIKKDKTNVRKAPDKGAEVSFVVDAGIPFKVMKREGEWIEVQHEDGDGGWVHKSVVW